LQKEREVASPTKGKQSFSKERKKGLEGKKQRGRLPELG
jgi:hypothetical protein